MKKYLLFIFCAILFVITSFTDGYAQSASATWALTVDTSVVVAGNITAPGQVLSKTSVATDTITVKDFTGGAFVNPAERLWLNGTVWPIESSQNNGRFVQFSISPASGNILTVQSVTLNIGTSGTSHMHASISYSPDSTFASSIVLYYGTSILPDIRTDALEAHSYAPNTNILSGQTFYLRINPWMDGSTSSTKYLCLTNVAISGTTGAIGSSSLIITPTSLSFGNAKVNTSNDKSFSVSGTNLFPASGTLTITSPTDFSVSITNGSGYSSSITIPYTGGTLHDTTVYARFTPTTVKSYSDSILVSGGGASIMKVAVTGIGAASNAILGIFVSTNGSDINLGTFDKPFATIGKAISVAVPGDTIYVRGGVYASTAQITISSNGIDTTKRSCLMGYMGERPILDFSSMGTPRLSGSADGIRLTGKYWHVKGLDFKGAPHNGIQINGGNYNIIEFCAMYENRNTGLQLSTGASYNKIINCDAYYNRDSSSASSYDGNADGFSPKLNNGTLNYFYGCRSWQNSDDGWDGYVRPAAPVAGKDTMETIIENCWCFSNGYLKNGIAGTGNGNGFKMGGGDNVGGASNGDSLRHNMTLIHCLSFNNLAKGFDQNNNRGTMTLINCTGYSNGSYNFSVPGFIRVGETLTVKNCISLGSTGITLAGVPNPILATNSWMAPFTTVTSLDFISIDTSGVRGPRKADGSLPDITFMHLAQGSQFIDAGTNVGLPFNRLAPDLGCFESDYVTGVNNQNDVRISEYMLLQNYPNPFNPSTLITFYVGEKGFAKLQIVNILGQHIQTLFAGQADPQKRYDVVFQASTLPSGVYFSILESSGERFIRKMLLVK